MIGYAVAFVKDPKGNPRDTSNLELISFLGFEPQHDVTEDEFNLESLRVREQAIALAKRSAAKYRRLPVVLRATTEDEWVRKQMQEQQGETYAFVYDRHRDAESRN